VSITGLFGKLPAHGDFIRRALPDSFVEPWYAWLQQGMAEARAVLGEGFSEAWPAAPAWRFRLPAGACGPDEVVGVMLPSEDFVGRLFPLTLATLPELPPDEAFFAALEAAGRDSQSGARCADALLAALPPASPGEAPEALGWWRIEDGAVLRWNLAGLPPPAQFRVLVEGGA